MDQQTNQEIATVEEAISQIQRTLDSQSQDWRSYLPRARAIIALLENTPIILELLDMERRTSTLATLQQLSYQDPDNGGERDIARWCERQWATILQAHPNNARALQGLGQAWLFKSEETLARIYRDTGSSSSDANGSPSASTRRSQTIRNSTQDNARVASADYVQARDLLRPAIESFDRAIEIADSDGSLTGKLLSLGAETNLNFGNVSHPRLNEGYYQKALRYLQRANSFEGFELENHLQQ
ncbi:hypothetical protein MMC14_000953 [Varicellaria rhodocarpa]|nr:hypothetical protein [Varicellaria rhodocarpa]